MLADTSEFADFTLRQADYTLSTDQNDLREAYSHLLATYSPLERVRLTEREPSRFDSQLWERMNAMGVSTFVLPEDVGGDGGSLVDIVLVAEEIGRAAASVALAETAAVGRTLARLDTPPARELMVALRDGKQIVSAALEPLAAQGRALVTCGSVADSVVGLVGGDLMVWAAGSRHDSPDNMASSPLAYWDLDPDQSVSLASGPQAVQLFSRLRREWRLITAAALVGLAKAALDEAVAYAKDRHAFGLPIGSYQAISHPLVDIDVALIGARRLIHKAAWFEDNDRSAAPELALVAVAFAADTAVSATATCVHTLGGIGVTNEANMQLYFRRAKAWALFGGDPMDELADLFGDESALFDKSANAHG
jgi:alkylation response protein AidB-like acyl-CoA dehydrogenase